MLNDILKQGCHDKLRQIESGKDSLYLNRMGSHIVVDLNMIRNDCVNLTGKRWSPYKIQFVVKRLFRKE